MNHVKSVFENRASLWKRGNGTPGKCESCNFRTGGVGGYTAEALARSGVGTFDLIDDDKVCLTNLNRQIIATRKTVGKQKVEVMRDRILEINPHARIHLHNCFYLPDQRDLIDLRHALTW